MKIKRFLEKHPLYLEGRNILFVGWTGSIGFEALKIIASSGATLYLASRSKNKAEKMINALKELFPSASIELFELDISLLRNIDSFVSTLEERNIHFDYFINNAGVYHLPMKETPEGYDLTFATNTLGHIYLLERMIPLMNSKAKIISTSSMSYSFFKNDMSDVCLAATKSKMRRYSLSKQELTNCFMHIKETTSRKDIEMNLVHPGIVPTELFEKSHGKLFMAIVFPLMKLLFHSPRKASLSIIYGMMASTKSNEWIGPRGLLEIWGTPKVHRMRKSILKRNEEAYSRIKEYMEKTTALFI